MADAGKGGVILREECDDGTPCLDDSLRKLVAGRVDYALVYDRVANEIAVNNQALWQQFRLRGTLLETGLYLSFSKRFEGAAALVQKFDTGLETIRKNGEYARIEARWR